jgi:hypothetical protein
MRTLKKERITETVAVPLSPLAWMFLVCWVLAGTRRTDSPELFTIVELVPNYYAKRIFCKGYDNVQLLLFADGVK